MKIVGTVGPPPDTFRSGCLTTETGIRFQLPFLQYRFWNRVSPPLDWCNRESSRRNGLSAWLDDAGNLETALLTLVALPSQARMLATTMSVRDDCGAGVPACLESLPLPLPNLDTASLRELER